MATWFSATAIVPELAARWALGASAAAWLTIGVQVGFVAGALASSLVNLADVVRLDRLMAAAAALGAAANLALLAEPGAGGGDRGADRHRGGAGRGLSAGAEADGDLVPARPRPRARLPDRRADPRLGAAAPVPRRSAALDWRLVVGAELGGEPRRGGDLPAAIREGPYPFARATMDPRQIGAVFRNRPLMLANLGYFGHMWELYAMWGWFLAFAAAAGEAGDGADRRTRLARSPSPWSPPGLPGCVLGGLLSDRIGRTLTTARADGGLGRSARS